MGLLGALSSGLFAALLFGHIDSLEYALVRETMAFEMDQISASPHQGERRIGELYLYSATLEHLEKIPTQLRDLPPGEHRLQFGGASALSLVRVTDHYRFVVLHGENLLQRRRSEIAQALALSVLGIALFSGVLGFWFANRILGPLRRLAKQVGELPPDGSGEPLNHALAKDEVASLAQALDDHRIRLRGFVLREQAFTHDVSHELQTPLTVIGHSLELLRLSEELPASTLPPVARIERARTDMARISEALLWLAREHGSGDPIPPCEVEFVLRRALDDLAPLFGERAQRTRLERIEPLTLHAPACLVYVVIANLLRNAVRHTRKGHVTVSLVDGELSVADSGSGLSLSKARPMLHPCKADLERDGGPQGIGLGLIGRICEQMRWQARVEQAEQGGTWIGIRFVPAKDVDQ